MSPALGTCSVVDFLIRTLGRKIVARLLKQLLTIDALRDVLTAVLRYARPIAALTSTTLDDQFIDYLEQALQSFRPLDGNMVTITTAPARKARPFRKARANVRTH